ncbi:MAG: cytidylate kinase family protein [Pseudomonadota bacterium]
MATLTISRQVGSLGDEIAEITAERLGYTLIDKDTIHDRIMMLPDDFSIEMNSLEKESQPGFFQRIFHHQAVYVNLISTIVYDAISKDNVVLKGRGGQFLLTDRENVLNARIVAPLDYRVSLLKAQQPMEDHVAEDLITQLDRDRDGFIRYLFGKDATRPDWYDIIINTKKFNTESAVDILTRRTEIISKDHPLSPELKDIYQSLALKSLVEAILQKRMPDSNYIKVKATPDGVITISGYIATHSEKEAAGEHAKTITGVTSVINRIHVAHFPVTTWP